MLYLYVVRASVGRVTLNGLCKPDWQRSSHILHTVEPNYFLPYCQNISIQLRASICRLSNTCIFVLFDGVLIYSKVALICSTCRRQTGNFKSPQQARLAKILTYRFLFSLLIVNSNVLHVETKKREMSFQPETVRACGCI